MIGALGVGTLRTLASFDSAGLEVELQFGSKVPGIPRLGELGFPSLGVAGLRMVVADLMEMLPREVTSSFSLRVDRLRDTRVESGATVGEPSISPNLRSNLGEPRLVPWIGVETARDAGLFLASMLAFENRPGFLLHASCVRIASRVSGSLRERTASASRFVSGCKRRFCS